MALTVLSGSPNCLPRAVPTHSRRPRPRPLQSVWRKAPCSATDLLSRSSDRSLGNAPDTARSPPWCGTHPTANPAPPVPRCPLVLQSGARIPSRLTVGCRVFAAPTALMSWLFHQSHPGKPCTPANRGFCSNRLASPRQSTEPTAPPKLTPARVLSDSCSEPNCQEL